MRRRDEKPSQRMDPSSAGEEQDFAEAVREFELRSANRFSDVECEAIQHGIDAAKVGSFAPQEEMDEFYRLHRGVYNECRANRSGKRRYFASATGWNGSAKYDRMLFMSNKLKELLERAEIWPEEVQEEAADILLSLEERLSDHVVITPEDRAAFARSRVDVKSGRIASPEQLKEFFARYRVRGLT
jgi:dsDNA-binding SOS-regulon protein